MTTIAPKNGKRRAVKDEAPRNVEDDDNVKEENHSVAENIEEQVDGKADAEIPDVEDAKNSEDEGVENESPGASPAKNMRGKRVSPKKKSPKAAAVRATTGQQVAIQPQPGQFPVVPAYGYNMMMPMGYAMPPPQHMPPHLATNPNFAMGNVAAPDLGLTGQRPLAPYGGYTDVSNMNDPAPDTRRNRGGVTEPFPEKLHKMLQATEGEGLTDVVSFFSHGRAFAIHKPRRFVQEIMPRFFNQNKLTSFQRQLNLYGFKRISQGPDNGGYYHELFLRGRNGLCVNMKRTKVKGTVKKKALPGTEPNFYTYPPIKTTHPQSAVDNDGAASPSMASPRAPTNMGMGFPGSPSSFFPFPPMQQRPFNPMSAGPYTAAQQPSSPMGLYPYGMMNLPTSPGQGQQGQMSPVLSPVEKTSPKVSSSKKIRKASPKKKS